MKFIDNVFPTLVDYQNNGNRVVIATLVNIEGSAPRPLGSQLGISADGRFVGLITGGCAEKAIVAEAQLCLKRNEDRVLRYGKGSPFIDVVLPCGSGIDLHFATRTASDILDIALSQHAKRRPFWLHLKSKDASIETSLTEPSAECFFRRRYDPNYRILVFGEGVNLVSFAALAAAAGYEVHAFSPDSGTLSAVSNFCAARQHIHKNFAFSMISMDRFSCVVTLFHEHDWEYSILHAALNSDADYIGALGSRKTHQTRIEVLESLDSTRRPIASIRGPIGLSIGAENPLEIGVSILAEITSHRRKVSK